MNTGNGFHCSCRSVGTLETAYGGSSNLRGLDPNSRDEIQDKSALGNYQDRQPAAGTLPAYRMALSRMARK
jgi:hypothetical protein